MSKFNKGQIVYLKSNNNMKGAIVEIFIEMPENRYQVFTSAGLQTYYESQLVCDAVLPQFENVGPDRFHAGITASLIYASTHLFFVLHYKESRVVYRQWLTG